ncbi:MAG: ATP-binding protein, partial [Candidatus Eisenbacteria bacterium]|nr:ATP-binding protein [Candidatus Eisenbacteria bacterium]
LGVVAVEGGSGLFAILSSLRRIWLVTGIGSAMIAVVLAILLIGVLRALARYEEGLRGATALASAGQLAAAVAHEIRNPLQVLQSRAERVQEELQAGTDRAEIQRLLDTIPSEVRRLDRILTNCLSLARVREESASSGVARVVEETVELLEKEMARSRIRIAVDPGPAGLRARIGPGPLRQALLNLCLNAREAMPEGGELSIGIERRDGWVRLAVRDTGVGIDRAVRDRVFEPFFTTRRSGSGLGLAVVDSILRRNGGRIEVQSEPGKGSVFTLWLPVDEKVDEKGDDEGDAGEARIVPDPAR